MKPCFHAGQGCRGPAGNPRFPGTCNPHATREGRDMTMTQYGTWVSYSGGARIELAIVLLAAAAGLAYAGTRLPLPARAARPGRAAMIFMLVTWVLAIAAFLACLAIYARQYRHDYPGTSYAPADHILPVTLLAAGVTFVIILISGGSYGPGARLARLSPAPSPRR